GRRVVVLFQPHRYSRTRDLMTDFVHAFDQADAVFITDIYPAGETAIPCVSGERLAEAVRSSGACEVVWIERKEELAKRVLPSLKSGDMVMTLGAGDIWKAGVELLEHL
ncbi:MAG: glutamate ligase domain-containing protein, partial [Gemmatimonadales bacterium]